MVNFALSTSVVFALVSVANAAPTLEARDASCNEQLGSSFFAIVRISFEIPSGCYLLTLAHQASDAVWCINYLASLGDQACVSNVSGVAFCRHGTVQITGLSRKVNVQATSSW